MLTYDMEARGSASLYQYLYKCIRSDIARGLIGPGEKLPSKRALAQHLGVSVITVEAAFDQLVAEGYVRSVPRSGFYACELVPALPVSEAAMSLPGKTTAASDPAVLADPAATSASAASSELPATSLFPYSTWAKMVRQTLTEETPQSLAAASAATGSLRLRRAIAAYVRGSRGLSVSPESIVVGAGTQQLCQLIVQLLGRGRAYAVEDPGYEAVARTYEACAARVVRVPLDECGMSAQALEVSDATVAHVAPARQFPTGATMPAARRRELLNWSRAGAGQIAREKARTRASFSQSDPAGSKAAEPDFAAEHVFAGDDTGCSTKPADGRIPAPAGAVDDPSTAYLAGRFIVEDDHGAELAVPGHAAPPLASIDGAGRVIYLNSFTESLGRAFRIAYLALPDALMQEFALRLGFYANTVSAVDQLALARFIEGGYYERHINRLRVAMRTSRERE